MREQSLGDIRFGTLARAAEGLTQWRPLLMSFLTLVVFSLLIALGASMLTKTVFISSIIMLIALVVLMAGSSAVGIMLMDKAKNEPIRSFAAAASAGLLCLPKFILVGLIVFAATLAYGLVAAIIYFVCKIPFLGGILAFVAHPILVLVAAALLIAMIWVIGPLMGPALWSGLSVKAALANVLSIARKRLVEVVLMEVVLYIILTLICVMLFAGLVPATMSLTGMAMSITSNASSMGGLGGYGYGGGMGSSMMGMMMGSSASTGLISGLGVLFAVIGALLAQVAVMGMNLIYLQARESVDPTEAEDALDGLIGDVRKKAEEAKAHTMAAAERTMAAAERAKQAASDRLQEASAKNATADTAADTAVNAEPATPAASTAPIIAATAVTAAAAAATEAHARQAAEEEAARLRTEAEVARVRADAEAARLKAEAQAQAERAAQERAEAQAAEAARQRAQAEAAERAAAAQAVQAAEEAREQANAARRASELQAQHEAEKREAERQEAAAREAARVKAEAQAQAQAQAQAEEKARQSQALTHCSACKATIAPDDVFCGECGHKLK